VANQRLAYRKNKISDERVQKLDDLGFSWGRGTIPKSKRRPTRGSGPRSVAGEAGDSEEDGGRKRKRRNAATAGDNAGVDSAPARSTTRSAGNSYSVEEASPSQSAAMKTELPVVDGADATDVLIKAETDDEIEAEEMEIEAAGSESSDLPPSNAHKSDTSDREGLIPSHEVTVLADSAIVANGEGNLKPDGLLPDFVPSSDPNHGHDETVCTTEVKLEEHNDANYGEDGVDEKTTGREGALLARIRALEAEVASLRGLAKVKQERIVDVKNELENAKEATEDLAQKLQMSEAACLELRELAIYALEGDEEVRLEAQRQLANASTERCMSSNCLGNLGSQRNVLTGCGHVVCRECLGYDVAFTGVDTASVPVMLGLRGFCACKVQGCTKKSREAWILKGICPPA